MEGLVVIFIFAAMGRFLCIVSCVFGFIVFHVAKLGDIPHCGSKLIMVDDQPIALFNIGGKILAWDNRCPHRGASLADGNISEDVISSISFFFFIQNTFYISH